MPEKDDVAGMEAADATSFPVKVHGIRWSGPLQKGCVEADPFVMWVAISFVTIVVILHFFLRGVKKPSARRKD
jgi:hypothetical protein